MSQVEIIEAQDTQASKATQETSAVALSLIDLQNKRFQVREGLDPGTVKAYENLLGDNDNPFKDPVLLWEVPDSKKLVILDGWHRIQAAVNQKKQTVWASVVSGISQADATIRAMRANFSHGLQLTLEERRDACFRVITALTKDDVQPANTVVAKEMGISEATVREYVQHLVNTGKLVSSIKKIGSDGKVQAATKARKSNPASGTTPSKPTQPVAISKAAQPMIHAAQTATSEKGTSASAVSAQSKTYPRIADDENSPGYQEARNRQNKLTQTLNAALFALSELTRTGWAEVFDPQGTEDAINELVETGKRALEARLGSSVVSKVA